MSNVFSCGFEHCSFLLYVRSWNTLLLTFLQTDYPNLLYTQFAKEDKTYTVSLGEPNLVTQTKERVKLSLSFVKCMDDNIDGRIMLQIADTMHLSRDQNSPWKKQRNVKYVRRNLFMHFLRGKSFSYVYLHTLRIKCMMN